MCGHLETLIKHLGFVAKYLVSSRVGLNIHISPSQDQDLNNLFCGGLGLLCKNGSLDLTSGTVDTDQIPHSDSSSCHMSVFVYLEDTVDSTAFLKEQAIQAEMPHQWR